MRKARVYIAVVLIIFVVPLFAGEQEEQLREEVSVVNVEVPVRVFSKGKTVDNLMKEDFELYEGRKPQEINGFFIKKQKIKSVLPAVHETSPTVLPSRYFVLIFRINSHSEDVRKALDHVFDNMLRENDQLMVFANEKSLSFNNLNDKAKAHDLVTRVLREQAQLAHNRMVKYLRRVEGETEYFYLIWLEFPGAMGAAFDFLNVHLQIWRDFKQRYLLPDMKKYFHFAQHLEHIKKEKWVINFYQMPMFPSLKSTGEARRRVINYTDVWRIETAEGKVIRRLLDTLDQEMNVAANFPVADISKLFYKVNATFHSILINNPMADFSEKYEYRRVASDIENSLRQITKDTGGKLIASNNISKALNVIEEKETVYYLLTYAPDNPNKVGKIRVKVKEKNCRVVYDDNIRADYINEYLQKIEAQTPDIQLQNLTFAGKKLSLMITDFLIKEEKQGVSGNVYLRVRIKDKNEKVLYDKNKTLQPRKNIITISIPFNWLNKGKYNIIADVKDLMTGKTEMKFIQPVIN
jgi:VWFA-related protein